MFKQRLSSLRQKLLKEKLDAVLISSVSNITYLTGYANFSKDEREAYIFIGKDFEYIITDGRYTEAVLKNVPHMTLFERGNKRFVEDLFEKHNRTVKRLGIEEDSLTVGEHKNFKKYFKTIKHFESGDLRSIKTNEEIKKIKKACDLGDLAFEYILQKIKLGISEKQLALELELFVKQNGAELSFPSIIAFGKNSSIPHHQTGDTVLKSGQLILMDFGVKLNDYCSDITRTVFFGEPNEKQKKIYEIVLEAQQKAVDFINSNVKSGKTVKSSAVDKIARDYITSKGFPTIPHSTGHGIGLEVHESPHLSPGSDEILKEGMVFSIEPGVYIKNFGGIRIEDLFVLEKNKLVQLTNASKKLIIVY